MKGLYCRRTVLSVLLVLGLVMAFSGVCMAATYSVSPTYTAADINEVINLLAAPGDTIIFNDGTYNIASTIVVEVNNLTLQSETTGGAKINASTYPVISVGDNIGITIDGLHFEAYDDSVTACVYFGGGSPTSPVTITNCTFVGFSEYTIEATNWESMTYDFTVTNNTFRYCAWGVYVQDFEDCTVDVSDNIFDNCADYAMEIGDLGKNGSTMTIRITGNTITAEPGSDCYAGIYIDNVEGETHISGNTITGDLEYGIDVNAIGVQGAGRVSAFIEKNEIRVDDGTGLDLGNLFTSVAGDLTVRYNTIETNADSDEASGIYVDSFNDADSTVTFRDNNIIGDTGVASWGFATMATVLIDAQGNWWGDASGPYDDKILPGIPDYNNPDGQGKKVTSYIDYENWRTTAWEEEDDDDSSGCSTGVLNPLFLLLLAPLGVLRRKSR